MGGLERNSEIFGWRKASDTSTQFSFYNLENSKAFGNFFFFWRKICVSLSSARSIFCRLFVMFCSTNLICHRMCVSFYSTNLICHKMCSMYLYEFYWPHDVFHFAVQIWFATECAFHFALQILFRTLVVLVNIQWVMFDALKPMQPVV